MTSAQASDLSETISSIVESVSPGVVRVEGGRRGPATGIVWEEGVVVTVDHALDREGEVTIGLPDGSTSQAGIAGRDPTTDVAVLRTEGPSAKPLAFADLEGVKVGHLAVAVARPGRSVRANLGVIGALGEGWMTYAGGRIDRYVQMDRGPLSGFSGGPLLDLSGQALGLVTAGLVRGATIGIPAATLRRVAGEILATGRAERGYLGVSCQAVPLPADVSKSLAQESGLLVFQVQGGSPAAEAGLMLGDVLLALDGSPLTRLSGLLAALSAGRAAGRSTVRLLRAGRIDDVAVSIGARSW